MVLKEYKQSKGEYIRHIEFVIIVSANIFLFLRNIDGSISDSFFKITTKTAARRKATTNRLP